MTNFLSSGIDKNALYNMLLNLLAGSFLKTHFIQCMHDLMYVCVCVCLFTHCVFVIIEFLNSALEKTSFRSPTLLRTTMLRFKRDFCSWLTMHFQEKS